MWQRGALGGRSNPKSIRELVSSRDRWNAVGAAMNLARRQFLHLVAGAAAIPTISRVAWAQAYPSRPITMIAPFAAGGPADVVGRMIAQHMGGSLQNRIIIENVTGADGNIGAGRLARARPDGYTIGLGTQASNVLNGAFYALPYDVLNDFAPISLLVSVPEVLFARKTMPAKDLNELITWLKANSNTASAGIGTAALRLITALFQKETGTRFALVPYRGGAPAIQDVVAGQIDLTFAPSDGLSLMRAGSIKAYAVTSERRLATAPEVPTVAEIGYPGLLFSTWFALFAPEGTPKDIIMRLNVAAVEALADPAVQSRLHDLGMEIFPSEEQTPEALGALVKADADKLWPLIKELGIKAE